MLGGKDPPGGLSPTLLVYSASTVNSQWPILRSRDPLRTPPHFFGGHFSFCHQIRIGSTVYVCALSCVWLFETPWTVAHQAPLFMGFSRQEYWSGLPFPPPGNLLNPGIEPLSLVSPASAGRFFTTAPPGKHWFHHQARNHRQRNSLSPESHLSSQCTPLCGRQRLY